MNEIIKRIEWMIALERVRISNILAQIYQKENSKVYCFNRNLPLKQINPKIEVEIKKIKTVDELEKYRKNMHSTYFIKFNTFLEHGCVGFFATKGEELLSLCWLTNLKKYCPSPYSKYLTANLDGVSYIFFCYTPIEYRGNRLCPYLLYNILDKEIKEDIVYIDAAVSNISSQKCIERVGFKLEYVLDYLRLFWRDIYFKKIIY